jgi:hypothetical protein
MGLVTPGGASARYRNGPSTLTRAYDFLVFCFPMLGNRFLTASLTVRCSAEVPCWATRASALRACALSGIGYLRFPGNANDFLLSFFRSLVLSSFAMLLLYPRPCF